MKRDSSQPIKLTIDDAKFREAMALLQGLKDEGRREAAAGLNELAHRWAREIKRHMPTDKGLARNSVQVRTAKAGDTPITASVGTNVPYVPFLEFGFPGGRGLFGALRAWAYGDEPIKHWYAKDRSILALMGKRDRARSPKSWASAQVRLDKAESANTEEFAPPFRGSWLFMAAAAVESLRYRLAKVLREKGKAT